MTAKAGEHDNEGKHLDMFNRRARAGQCFHRPALGTREFAADFELIENEPPLPHPDLIVERDLGYMLLDIDFDNGMSPTFFRAIMRDGIIAVPPMNGSEVVR
jgi:CRISPR-associated protein Cas5d